MLISHWGGRLHFDLVGEAGKQVVCLVHSLATDGGMWSAQVGPLLAAGYRVLRVDLRGHGGSDSIPGDYTMYSLADDVVAVLDYLKVDAAHYVGLSIGGMIGQAFGDRHGSRARSLILCDTEPVTPNGAAALWEPRKAIVREAGSLAPLAAGMVERWLTPAFKAAHPVRWQIVYDTIVATTVDGWLGCAAAILNFDFNPVLPGIKVPTLVLCGADDPATPPAANKHIAGLISGARYQEIAAAKHLPNVERPQDFNAALLGWLKSNCS